MRLALFGLLFTYALSRLTSLVQGRIDLLTEEAAALQKGAGYVWKKGRAEFYRIVESSSGWLVGCLCTPPPPPSIAASPPAVPLPPPPRPAPRPPPSRQVGCLCTDALFALVGQQGALRSALLALALLLFALGWLLATGAPAGGRRPQERALAPHGRRRSGRLSSPRRGRLALQGRGARRGQGHALLRHQRARLHRRLGRRARRARAAGAPCPPPLSPPPPH